MERERERGIWNCGQQLVRPCVCMLRQMDCTHSDTSLDACVRRTRKCPRPCLGSIYLSRSDPLSLSLSIIFFSLAFGSRVCAGQNFNCIPCVCDLCLSVPFPWPVPFHSHSLLCACTMCMRPIFLGMCDVAPCLLGHLFMCIMVYFTS